MMRLLNTACPMVMHSKVRKLDKYMVPFGLPQHKIHHAVNFIVAEPHYFCAAPCKDFDATKAAPFT
jgi:hypothetical protein